MGTEVDVRCLAHLVRAGSDAWVRAEFLLGEADRHQVREAWEEFRSLHSPPGVLRAKVVAFTGIHLERNERGSR
ncbi:hypothetical protein ACIGW3_08045 [Streptomyces sp. NPDC053499]|uniref:hypothetical protein n=1 Tax=Streptomyces sp. NPDC053499 TaxID=3365707 RepID=UPI0037D5AC2C